MLGYRLAGIDGIAVRSSTAARTALQQVIDEGTRKIILITKRFMSALGPQIEAHRVRQKSPHLVSINDMWGGDASVTSLESTIREALGVNIRESY